MGASQWLGHVLGLVFLLYIGQSLYQFYHIYHPPVCNKQGNSCLRPVSDYKKPVQIRIYASESPSPGSSAGAEVGRLNNLDIAQETETTITVALPPGVRRNGSLYFHMFMLPGSAGGPSPRSASWYLLQSVPMTKYMEPQPKAFSLVGDDVDEKKGEPDPTGKRDDDKMTLPKKKPVTHWNTRLPLVVVDDPISLHAEDVPAEIYHLIKVNEKGQYYPLFYADELSCRLKNLIEIKPDTESVNVTVVLRPVSVGKLRMLIVALQSTMMLRTYGFSEKDIDEVRSIFTETNFYLLALTLFVSSIHLLLDTLAFKNDIQFWRNRNTMTGLSSRTVIWNSVSHTIIAVYLLDEGTSKLVLVPACIGVVIEYWKLYKAFKMRNRLMTDSASSQEKDTEQFDSQGMKYLSYLLTPLCIGGAVYSLMYIPHKSWSSWLIQSLANGVYAFGFLFMLPQIFINYKLKSVAHLPWRAFMYKAFNTFIDDLFAFIIHMPTAHRLACFRDDVVFVIYLYQRWLYPVDKNRVNEFGESFADREGKDAAEAKKTK